jgi:hypothetical protein
VKLQSALLLLCFACAVPYGFAQNAPPAGAQGQRPAPAPPSNLKVLPKDITRADLNMTMRGFTQQLGVGCEFCHAANPEPKSSDANPHKDIARIMITMTADINAKYLAQVGPNHDVITCGNCHQGHTHPPAFTPTVNLGTPGMPPAAPRP